MKYIRILLFLAVSAFFSVDCFAAKVKKTSSDIAIVDLKKIAVESKAGKHVEQEISKINNLSKKDLLDLESKIKSMDTVKASEEDRRKVEDMQLILYDMVRTKRYQISEAYKKAIAVLESEIKKSVAYIAKRNAVKIVLASEAVIHASDDCIDITSQVITRVNEVCKEIPVTMSEG